CVCVKENTIKAALQSLLEQMPQLEEWKKQGSDNKAESGMALVEKLSQRAIALDEAVWKRLVEEYKSKKKPKKKSGNDKNKTKADPFELVIYSLLAKVYRPFNDVELQDFGIAVVIETIEDFLWYKLSTLYDEANALPEWLLRSNDNNNNNNDKQQRQKRYTPWTLAHLQQWVMEEGEEIAIQQDNWLLYPLWLLQTQQFEKSVLVLLQQQQQRRRSLESLHLGIALRYYGLLHVTEDYLLAPFPSRSRHSSSVVSLHSLLHSVALRLLLLDPFYSFHYLFILDEQSFAPFQSRMSKSKSKEEQTLEYIRTSSSCQFGFQIFILLLLLLLFRH
ncbi:hypothetical protein RFI_22211, partial [Reticulomyxa filosa]